MILLVQLTKVTVMAESSGFFLFFLDTLHSLAVWKHESGKCCSFSPFLTNFFSFCLSSFSFYINIFFCFSNHQGSLFFLVFSNLLFLLQWLHEEVNMSFIKMGYLIIYILAHIHIVSSLFFELMLLDMALL